MWLRAKREDGASAVEYGLLVAGIAALIVAMVFIFGDMLNEIFTGSCEEMKDNTNPQIVVVCS